MATVTTTIEDELAELGLFCGKVTEQREGERRYLLLERVTLPAGCSPAAMEALLCPQERDGYMTRLFLASPITGKGTNWTVHRILDRTWHSWSWQNVSANQRLAQILLGHLRGLQ